MSGIVGIYHLDGRPVDLELVQKMSCAIAHRGRDADGTWFNGQIGMAQRMFQTTPESVFEKQPLFDEGNQLCLAMDGRVDNRIELISALESKGQNLPGDSDAEIVLRAYEAWGENCAAKIIGDFAFAIWDGRLNRLFCARDFFGIRPFVYFFKANTFLWSSELHALFESPEVPRVPNEGMAGEYLAGNICNLTETLYQGILRLPPAHYMIVDASGIRIKRYWDFDASSKVIHQTDDQYAEHFYELFSEAVRCRMRSAGPVGADLSGGLDSSSVVGIAQELLRDGRVNGEGFEAISWAFPGLDCDESYYVNEVVSKWNLVSRSLTPEPVQAEVFIEQASRYLDFPGYPNAHALDSLRLLAKRHGCKVVLTGEGGDEWFSGMHEGLRETAREYLRSRVWPITPNQFQSFVRQCLNRPEFPGWINKEFAQRINLVERLRAKIHAPASIRFAQRERYIALADGFSIHAQELGERNAAWSGLEIRHPLCDRRIVEFGLAIPDEQRRRGGIDKYILRNAMKRSLPAAVLNRNDKAEFSHLFIDQMKALGGKRLFSSMEIANGSSGWINEIEVRSVYNQLESSAQENRPATNIWSLWVIWGVELWKRAAFGSKPRF